MDVHRKDELDAKDPHFEMCTKFGNCIESTVTPVLRNSVTEQHYFQNIIKQK